MNFYKRHIGDYTKKASHLTLLEHGIYARLMDVYYTREAGIPEDKAARLIGARTKDEQQALASVLEEFFDLVDGVWVQNRCEEEIAAASAQADANRNNGKKGGRPKGKKSESEPKNNPMGFDSDNEKNLSQTPDSRLQTKTLSGVGSTQPELKAATTTGEDDDRLPPRPQHPPVSPDMRAVAIATLLTGAGVRKVTAFHPDVAVTWAQDPRVTDELLMAAVKRAKDSLGDEPFHAPYLRPIIVELLNPPLPKQAGTAPTPAAPHVPRKPQGNDPKDTDESYEDWQARVAAYEQARRHGGQAA